jgi:transcriptional regulator with XRE-family HTH domain
VNCETGVLRINVTVASRALLNAGLRKQDLARRARVSPNTVTHIFQGRSVSLTVAKRVARALRTRLPWLIEAADWKKGDPGRELREFLETSVGESGKATRAHHERS